MNRGPADHPLERGIAILSLDTEQIWGHLDLLDESKFEQQYRQAPAAHYRLLRTFCSAGVGATWFVVGGMSLDASDGPQDPRMAGLPDAWVGRVPAGSEASRPLWYHRSFIEALRDARPRQEIGLHGGLTHLIWTHPQSTREVVKRELAQGMKALEQISVRPRSFSFGRDQEAYHDLLPPHGIRCYRGRTPVLAYRLGRTIPGAVMRILDELREATPPPVWPRELQPGLWNIPSSLFLYPIGAARARLIPLRSRVARFRRGLEAAIRRREIFHFSFHPDNLAESESGFSLLDDLLDLLIRARAGGDVEILTMEQAAERASRSVKACSAQPLADVARGITIKTETAR